MFERRGENLGLGLDTDVDVGKPGGEDACKALADERVDEVQAWLRQSLETPPSLNDAHACLVDTDTAERVSHLPFGPSPSLLAAGLEECNALLSRITQAERGFLQIRSAVPRLP